VCRELRWVPFAYRCLPVTAWRTSEESASGEAVRFGPIEFLLKDAAVTEVMVNGPDDVYVERTGPVRMVVARATS
jgi:Flp pilus assembly CpaF family ATPase